MLLQQLRRWLRHAPPTGRGRPARDTRPRFTPRLEPLETRAVLSPAAIDINPDPGESSYPDHLASVAGTLFFEAFDETTGVELWKTDPYGNTALVKDINPGPTDGFPMTSSNTLVDVNGTLFFSPDDGTTGFALWKSDGTAAGTVQVSAAVLIGGEVARTTLTEFGGSLFFAAYDRYGSTGYELWKSDGTAAGTVLVKDINPSGDSNPHSLTVSDGLLYFTADDGVNGRELWVSDGTAAGTVLVEDINPGYDGSLPVYEYVESFLFDMNGTVYFAANDGANGSELWTSAGTAAGTALVKDINPGGPWSDSNPGQFISVGGAVYFVAYEPATGAEVWKTDGTAAGTALVKDVIPNTGGPYFGPFQLTAAGDVFFFAADDGVHGIEVWRSDGTAAGTGLFLDINPFPYVVAGHSYAQNFTYVAENHTLYFEAWHPDYGQELYSVHVPTGGVALYDLTPGSEGTDYGDFEFVAGVAGQPSRLFFAGATPEIGYELWYFTIIPDAP
jgi:ELWxxDGT repeat protein